LPKKPQKISESKKYNRGAKMRNKIQNGGWISGVEKVSGLEDRFAQEG